MIGGHRPPLQKMSILFQTPFVELDQIERRNPAAKVIGTPE